MEIEITKVDPAELKEIPEGQFGFGRLFTDYMLTRRYSSDSGWGEAKIEKYAPVAMPLATQVFHYAQEIFEGTKGYRRPDGHINLFRIHENIKRFNRSAVRMEMPQMDEEEQLECIVRLIELDSNWVPSAPHSSLYIRPTMIATEESIGMGGSHFLFFIILSPVDPFFPSGFKPISVFVEDQYVRAVRGGVGEAKTGGNYAASQMATRRAKEAGYAQVLWLDAVERRYVEEMGGMNVFFVYGNKLVTPPLTGTILPGVTRDSLLVLGRDLGYEVEERMVDIDELVADMKAGRVTEAFACGTAAVIAPISMLAYKGEEVTVAEGETGKITQHLYDELTGIQYGRIPDRFGWTLKIEADS